MEESLKQKMVVSILRKGMLKQLRVNETISYEEEFYDKAMFTVFYYGYQRLMELGINTVVDTNFIRYVENVGLYKKKVMELNDLSRTIDKGYYYIGNHEDGQLLSEEELDFIRNNTQYVMDTIGIEYTDLDVELFNNLVNTKQGEMINEL